MPSLNTETDKELYKRLIKIDNREIYSRGIFEYCESQEDREKLLAFIKYGHTDRVEVLLMANQLGIESGTVEGEFEDEV